MSERYVKIKMLKTFSVVGDHIGETVYELNREYQMGETLARKLCSTQLPEQPVARVVDIYAEDQHMDAHDAADFLTSLQPIPAPEPQEGG